MELFDLSVLALPAGAVLAIVVGVSLRSGWPLAAALLGALVAGVLGRLAWEWFADPPPGFDFGSELEGYDWVLGSACVGVLVGALAGSALAVTRRRRRAPG